MKSEDAGDVCEVQEDASQTRTKKLVRKRKEMSKSCEKEYVPKIKAAETKYERSSLQMSEPLLVQARNQQDCKNMNKN